MWAPGFLLAIAALIGATVMFLYSGLFVIGIPLFVLGVVAIGVLDLQRRRRHVGEVDSFRDQAKAEEIEFTERDKQTLAN
jgi:hypothetical protein